MGGGTDSYDRLIEERERRARALRAEANAETAACGWRPINRDSMPPENTVVLVRYRGGRTETAFYGVSRFGATVDKHHVYPALTVYGGSPFGKEDRVFRGFVVLEPRLKGTADAVKYLDGDVSEAFDAWMPCPT